MPSDGSEYDSYWADYESAKEEFEDAMGDIETLVDELETAVSQMEDAVASGAMALAKIYADCISDICGDIAALLTVVAGLLWEFPPLMGLATVDVGIYWLASNLWAEVAEDPPQDKYKKHVAWPAFKPFPMRKPAGVKGASHHVNLIRHGRRFCEIAPTMLDAMERHQGAVKANDARYARRHARMIRVVGKIARKKTALMKASMLGVAKSLEGTPHNKPVTKAFVRAFVAGIRKNGLPEYLKEGLKTAGLTPVQMTAFAKWFVSYDFKGLKDAKISWHLRNFHFRLHSAETKLEKM